MPPLPEPAERELDGGRTRTFTFLAALLRAQPTAAEPSHRTAELTSQPCDRTVDALMYRDTDPIESAGVENVAPLKHHAAEPAGPDHFNLFGGRGPEGTQAVPSEVRK